MQEFQIDPATILTQAALSSMFAGATAFVSTLMSHFIIQPLIATASKQIASVVTGGLTSLNNDGAPPPFLMPPNPPPLLFSITPDGQIHLSMPVNEVVEKFMPFLNVPTQEGGAVQ